jgi:PEGA domain
MTPPTTPQPFQLGPVPGKGPSTRLDKDPFTGLEFPGPAPVPKASVPPDVMLLGPSAEPAPITMAPMAPVTPMTPPPRVERPEVNPASFMPAPRKKGLSKSLLIGLGVVALAAAAVPSVAYFRSHRAAATPAPSAVPAVVDGSATIMSRPDGAEVLVDGVSKGVTPLKLTLPVGTYTLELHNGTSKRTVPLMIEAGSAVRQYVDLAPADGGAGRLEVTSDPAGAQVIVDGSPRGVTPLVITAIEPGPHRVAVAGADSSLSRSVTVSPGATSSVVLSLAPAGAAGGWVSVKAPFELQVLENGKVIGTSSMDSLMLPAGSHDLELVSTAFSFDTTLNVRVVPGKTVALPVTLPQGTLSINALPWADVMLDGQPVGQTPLGNLSVTIGTHEIVWRHPELGERRETVKVTAGAPVRAGMDLTK